MERPRIVIYGVGAMGSLISRMIVEKDGEIVGAIGRSPEKVGRDLGDVAELGRETGVTPEEAAQKWIDANPDTVAAWLDGTGAS